jgi:hypothetical protein
MITLSDYRSAIFSFSHMMQAAMRSYDYTVAGIDSARRQSRINPAREEQAGDEKG